jgi:uncharacterized protein (TIGR00369 family)
MTKTSSLPPSPLNPALIPLDPVAHERIHQSFLRQNAMELIKASMPVIGKGYAEIHLPHWDGIEQQHGFVHGGVIGMIADSAAGYAAMSVTPPDHSVLTVEYKMNIMAPGLGETLIAAGKVIKAGRKLIITTAEVFNLKDGRTSLCALMQQTIMVMAGTPESERG